LTLHLVDTNIAIHLRDSEPAILARVDSLPARPLMSILTVVELEGGVVSEPNLSARRRVGVDSLLASLGVVDFGQEAAIAYRKIVEARGFVRSRIVDRMIAATAIAHDLTLITINGADFRDIPGLALEIWPSPAAQ
jgi:tRNA(fMet)-specific endonuclease VapC